VEEGERRFFSTEVRVQRGGVQIYYQWNPFGNALSRSTAHRSLKKVEKRKKNLNFFFGGLASFYVFVGIF